MRLRLQQALATGAQGAQCQIKVTGHRDDFSVDRVYASMRLKQLLCVMGFAVLMQGAGATSRLSRIPPSKGQALCMHVTGPKACAGCTRKLH
jgi:hypothetical protein